MKYYVRLGPYKTTLLAGNPHHACIQTLKKYLGEKAFKGRRSLPNDTFIVSNRGFESHSDDEVVPLEHIMKILALSAQVDEVSPKPITIKEHWEKKMRDDEDRFKKNWTPLDEDDLIEMGLPELDDNKRIRNKEYTNNEYEDDDDGWDEFYDDDDDDWDDLDDDGWDDSYDEEDYLFDDDTDD